MRILPLVPTAGLVVTGCAASAPDQPGPVSVSVSSCGAGWTDPAAGPQHIQLHKAGHNGAANREYDLSWFDQAVKKNSLPAVSFVKAAVVIAYDDSDGWYDHAFVAPKNGSSTSEDTTMCSGQAHVTAGYQGRCGPGPRLPLLVISPYARRTSSITGRPSRHRSRSSSRRTGSPELSVTAPSTSVPGH